MKKLFLICSLLAIIEAVAQTNFSVSPKLPQSGEVVKFTYTPAGDLATITETPNAYAIKLGSNLAEMEDVFLKKENGQYVGTINTDNSVNIIVLKFFSGDKTDNNNDNGYIVLLYNKGIAKKGVDISMAQLYAYYADRFGLKSSTPKSLAYYKKAFAQYPDLKQKYAPQYYTNVYYSDPKTATKRSLQTIDSINALPKKKQEDYEILVAISNFKSNNADIKKYYTLLTKNFPDKLYSTQTYSSAASAYNQGDNVDAQKIEEIALSAINNGKKYNGGNPYTYIGTELLKTALTGYIEKKDFKSIDRLTPYFTKKSDIIALHNKMAYYAMQDTTGAFDMQAVFEKMKEAHSLAKSEITNPTDPKPNLQLNQGWLNERQTRYIAVNNTYANLLYKLGKYEEALPYAQEGIEHGKEHNVTLNYTWILIAEKVLPLQEFQPRLEKLFLSGRIPAEIREVLKRTYIRMHNSEEGYDEYLAALDNQITKKVEKEITHTVENKMLNEPAPAFTVKDLTGKTVSSADLKGKVVILDFWATWCSPCISSFPAMQKMVDKYKNDPDVMFLFVNTKETADDKEAHVKEFFKDKNYTFQVLMDQDDIMSEEFSISGYPTKLILGRDGNIKFRSTGYQGDDLLMFELDNMINVVKKL